MIGNFSILQRHLGLMLFTAALFLGVYFIGSSGVTNMSHRIEDYARWSEIDMVMNEDVNQTTLSLIGAVQSYKAVPSEQNYAQVQSMSAAAHEGLAAWLEMIADKEDLTKEAAAIKPQIDSIAAVMADYKKGQDERKNIVTESNRIIAGVIAELDRAMVEFIDPVKEQAGLDADIPELIRWGEIDMVMNEAVIANALKLQTAIHDYAYLTTPANFSRFEKVLAGAREGLAQWSGTVKTDPDLKRIAAGISGSYDKLNSQLITLRTLSGHLAELDAQIDDVADSVAATTTDIMTRLIDPAKDRNLVAANEVKTSTSKLLMTVGVVALGLLILSSIGLALFESRILKRLIAGAELIAKGDFSLDPKLEQKDELGQISRSLSNIRASVMQALEENDQIIREAEFGKFNARGEATKFQGAYAELIEGSNSLMDIFEALINRLPVGVLSRSVDRDVLYLNAMLKEVTYLEDFAGHKCNDLFNTGDCEGNCASDLSLKTGKVESSETVCKLAKSEHEIAYTAIPMQSRSGEWVGVMEIIQDQTTIKQANRAMSQASEEADVIADRLSSAAEELAAQVEQAAQGADVQRRRIDETATAMEEMSATVLEVARNASKATEQSESARSKAEEGAGLVGRVVEGINEVNNVALNLQQNIENLGSRADAIGGIMTVISDIADQTNLLALNAAIEAARAGEAGRGFAVVADEVRKLAEKTVAATNEVGEAIRDIQDATGRSVRGVDEAVGKVAEATELANESGAALSEIVSVAGETSIVISSIATAAEEQSATAEEINRAVDDVNLVASENADGMAQSANAVQELAGMAAKLRSVLENLRSVGK